MTKAELEKELKRTTEENQILFKLLEQKLGYQCAHELIDRAKLEYAVMLTNLVLEKR